MSGPRAPHPLRHEPQRTPLKFEEPLMRRELAALCTRSSASSISLRRPVGRTVLHINVPQSQVRVRAPLGSVTTSEPPERVGLYPTTWKASWPCSTHRCDLGELRHHRDSGTRLVGSPASRARTAAPNRRGRHSRPEGQAERELERRAQRRLAVLRHMEEVSGNVAATCRCYGISRQCYYGWLRRFEADGLDGLKDRSQRPRHSPRATQAGIVEKIIWLRQHYHFGPAKIAMYLGRYHDVTISVPGVWRGSVQ
jgi:transposase